MKQLKLKPPIIVQENGYVKVVLRHEPLATPEEAILEYLLENPEIANRNAREICFIGSENRMKRILQILVQNELLEPVPGRTRYTAAYQLTAKGRATARSSLRFVALDCPSYRASADCVKNLKLMRIHNKPRMLGEFVVEGAAAGVGGLGGPVNARATCFGCGGIDGLDELRADALAAMLGGDDEVLQVAHVIEPRGAAVKNVMH